MAGRSYVPRRRGCFFLGKRAGFKDGAAIHPKFI
jgi:hypothetical protein